MVDSDENSYLNDRHKNAENDNIENRNEDCSSDTISYDNIINVECESMSSFDDGNDGASNDRQEIKNDDGVVEKNYTKENLINLQKKDDNEKIVSLNSGINESDDENMIGENNTNFDESSYEEIELLVNERPSVALDENIIPKLSLFEKNLESYSRYKDKIYENDEYNNTKKK